MTSQKKREREQARLNALAKRTGARNIGKNRWDMTNAVAKLRRKRRRGG